MRVGPFASLLVLSLIAPMPTLGQSGDDQVQLGANLVELRAVVTDSKGRLVTGLAKSDFEVVDAGVAEEIEFFSELRVAGSGDAPTVAAGASATVPVQPAEPAVRTVVLFVDDFHLAPNSLANVRKALKRFVGEQLTDRDVLGLVSASGRVQMFGQFGADRSAALAAIDAIPLTPPAEWATDFPPFLAAQVMLNEGGDGVDNPFIQRAIKVIRARDHDEYSSDESIKSRAIWLSRQILEQEEAWATASLDALKRLCDQLAGLPGQRLVLMYSDGFNLRDDRGVPSTTRLYAVVSHAARAGVVVSAIIASGLSVDSGVSAEVGSRPDPGGMSLQLARGEALDRESGPGAVAKQTGGIFYRNRNDLDVLGRDLLAQNATYYAIGYYTPDPNGASYREVEVRVRDHPGFQVRAQRGYVPTERRAAAPAAAPGKEEAKDQVIDALLRTIQAFAIDVALDLGGFAPEKDKARVDLSARVAGNTLDIRDVGGGRHTLALDVTVVVFDLAGKPVFVGSDHASSILATEEAEAARQGAALRYPVPIAPLKPGIYQARVAIYEQATRRVGARSLWFVVPNVKK